MVKDEQLLLSSNTIVFLPRKLIVDLSMWLLFLTLRRHKKGFGFPSSSLQGGAASLDCAYCSMILTTLLLHDLPPRASSTGGPRPHELECKLVRAPARRSRVPQQREQRTDKYSLLPAIGPGHCVALHPIVDSVRA